jgi:hypothetical protein
LATGRAAGSLDGLVEIQAPEIALSIRPFEARWWKPETDYPTHDSMPPDIDENYYDIAGIDLLEGTKLGGWPLCIQSESWWDYTKSH